jgi:hypothetical protein
MQKPSKILVIVGIIAAVVVAGILFGWLGGSGSAPVPVPTPEISASTTPPPPPTPQVTAVTPAPPADATATTMPTETAPAMAQQDLSTNWEDRVDEILASADEDTNKVKRLFEMFPRLPDDGKVEVARHLSNLVADPDYAPLGQLLQNAREPDSVLDVLMQDAVNRPNSLKLPVLLDVAQNPDNPKSGDAKDILALYLDGDFGTNWSIWQQKMQDWLKQNPD